MLAIAQVLDVVPSSTKYGDKPSEERRNMILRCCGMYETSMPTRMKLLLLVNKERLQVESCNVTYTVRAKLGIFG